MAGGAPAFVRRDHHFFSYFHLVVRFFSFLSFLFNELRSRLAYVLREGRAGVFTLALFFLSIFFGMSQGASGEVILSYFSSSLRHVVGQTGFTVRSITVSGLTSLDISKVLDAANIDRSYPLFFLNIDSVRERLARLPLVRSVSIRKYYPDGLSVGVVEASPDALWQIDGSVFFASHDGQLIAPLQETVDKNLPLVVGPDAGPHIAEFLAMMAATPDLPKYVKAGVWVGGRRWTLSLTNGVDVFLPEGDVSPALNRLVKLIRDRNILDSAIVSVDLRQSDRVILGLSDNAFLERLESQKLKNKARGVHA